jgi:hypothetical protein
LDILVFSSDEMLHEDLEQSGYKSRQIEAWQAIGWRQELLVPERTVLCSPFVDVVEMRLVRAI